MAQWKSFLLLTLSQQKIHWWHIKYTVTYCNNFTGYGINRNQLILMREKQICLSLICHYEKSNNTRTAMLEANFCLNEFLTLTVSQLSVGQHVLTLELTWDSLTDRSKIWMNSSNYQVQEQPRKEIGFQHVYTSKEVKCLNSETFSEGIFLSMFALKWALSFNKQTSLNEAKTKEFTCLVMIYSKALFQGFLVFSEKRGTNTNQFFLWWLRIMCCSLATGQVNCYCQKLITRVAGSLMQHDIFTFHFLVTDIFTDS